MMARLSALVIWAAVAASAVFWGLRLFVSAPALPAGTAVVESAQAARGDVVRLLGASPVQAAEPVQAPPQSSRFQLSGVMAPRQPGSQGVALIAIDGKPPRAFRVGARVDGDMVLQAVSLRTATLGAAGAGPGFKMEIPPLPPAATGSLPPINMNDGLAVPPAILQAGQVPPQLPIEIPGQNINDQVPMPVQAPPPVAVPPRPPLGRMMPAPPGSER